MTYNELHIGNFASNRYLPLKVLILGFFSAVIIKVAKRFWLKTGTINGMVKDLNSINRDATKLLNKLSKGEISKDEVVELFPRAERSLKRFTSLYTNLEKRKFLGNARLESAAERVLLNLYKLESDMRAIALADVNCVEQDSSLIEFASNISLGSLKA